MDTRLSQSVAYEQLPLAFFGHRDEERLNYDDTSSLYSVRKHALVPRLNGNVWLMFRGKIVVWVMMIKHQLTAWRTTLTAAMYFVRTNSAQVNASNPRVSGCTVSGSSLRHRIPAEWVCFRPWGCIGCADHDGSGAPLEIGRHIMYIVITKHHAPMEDLPIDLKSRGLSWP
ncbi:hypothetical protein BGZ63DRAFT_380446 [Mariannaea sp. PMI_226]|nr:hypothetical protein BGZ63DRAFT_380446 [Mariannaea sp. PMI_226]